MNRRTAVIIPAYNEEYTIGDVVRGVKMLGVGYDVIVVNDNSSDKTSEKAKEEGAKVVELSYNLGIGGAVQTGYKYALAGGYDACVQVDGDGQHPTQEIVRLVEALFENGYDMVIGSRFVEDTDYQVSFMRDMGIKILSFFLRMTTGLVVKDPTSGFRAINRKALTLFSSQYPQDYPEPESLVFARKRRFKIKEVPVKMKSRTHGMSSITPLLAAYYMGKVLLAMFIALFKKL
ncbi:MAG: glycosyltransferase family 2 protein [Syntrophobacterales bacterium]|jgi:glycosyltransferase involved in cell wall biosynthesis|nr:glycosyltransferase family 2 protein [Syntrophobacterales bacterium]